MFWPKPFLRGQFLLSTVVGTCPLLLEIHQVWLHFCSHTVYVNLTSLLCPLLAATLQRRSFGRKGRCGFHFLNSCSSEYSVTRSPPPPWTPTYCYSTVCNTQLTIDHLFLVDVAFWLFKKSTEQRHKCKLSYQFVYIWCYFLINFFLAWCFQGLVLPFQHMHVLVSRLVSEWATALYGNLRWEKWVWM